MPQESTGPSTFVFKLIALILGLMGLVFLFAAGQGNATVRLVIGAACLSGAGALIYLARMRPVQHTHVHKMELDMPGQVSMKSFECKSCGATLESKAAHVVSGAVQVDCPYCGTSYQLEEAPKW